MYLCTTQSYCDLRATQITATYVLPKVTATYVLPKVTATYVLPKLLRLMYYPKLLVDLIHGTKYSLDHENKNLRTCDGECWLPTMSWLLVAVRSKDGDIIFFRVSRDEK